MKYVVLPLLCMALGACNQGGTSVSADRALRWQSPGEESDWISGYPTYLLFDDSKSLESADFYVDDTFHSTDGNPTYLPYRASPSFSAVIDTFLLSPGTHKLRAVTEIGETSVSFIVSHSIPNFTYSPDGAYAYVYQFAPEALTQAASAQITCNGIVMPYQASDHFYYTNAVHVPAGGTVSFTCVDPQLGAITRSLIVPEPPQDVHVSSLTWIQDTKAGGASNLIVSWGLPAGVSEGCCEAYFLDSTGVHLCCAVSGGTGATSATFTPDTIPATAASATIMVSTTMGLSIGCFYTNGLDEPWKVSLGFGLHTNNEVTLSIH